MESLENIPPINNYSSRSEWEKDVCDKILSSKKLLKLLLTAHERRDLVLRAAILEKILSGKSYRDIGRELWCSPQTVSGMKKAFLEKNYKSYAERSKKERKKKQYSKILVSKKHRQGKLHRTKYGNLYF